MTTGLKGSPKTVRPMNRSALGWAGVAFAGMVLAGATMAAPAARADEVTKTFTVTGHARVRVQTDDGGVRVSTGDIKQVEIRVEYAGYKLDRDLQVTTSQNGDSVEVTAKTHGSWSIFGMHRTSLRVEVHMPKTRIWK